MRLLSLLFLSFSLMMFAADTPPVQTPVSAYTADDIALAAEGAPSTFVNHVNTVFGNFLLPTVDFVVPGPTPMPMVRYYNSDSSTSTWLHGVGMSSNYPLWIHGAFPSEAVFHQTIPKISFPLQQTVPHRWPTPEDDLELDDGPEAEALCEAYIREREKVSPSPREEDVADFLEEEPLEKGLSHREERERRREAKAAQRANERAAWERERREEREREKERERRKAHPHRSQDDKKYAYAYAEEDGGSVLYFTAKPERKEMVFYLDPQTIHKGLTNVGSGEISARTNLKNMRFHSKVKRNIGCSYIYDPNGYDAEWTVALSNGGERRYNCGKSFRQEKTIQEEVKPNGNKLLFTCSSSKNFKALQKIVSADNNQRRHFGWIEAKYPAKKNKVFLHSSTGQFAAYHYEYHSTKKTKDAPYITKIYSSNQPTTSYEYTSCNGKRLMSKIIFPKGRYLRITYDSKGRVEEQRGPVGKHNKEETIFRFKYHPEDHHTTVYDANDNKTRYHYSSKKRLKSIEHLDEKEKLIREEKFFWGIRRRFLKESAMRPPKETL